MLYTLRSTTEEIDMFEINLIREKRIPPEFKKNVLNNLVIAGVICGVIMIFIFVRFISTVSKISKYRDEKKTISVKIDDMVGSFKIREWVNEWSDTLDDLRFINGIYNERTVWTIKLEELLDLLPEKMCIVKINMDNKKTEITLNLIALDEKSGELKFDAVKGFLNDLDVSSTFGKGAKLKYQERDKLGTLPVKYLTITIPLAGRGKVK